MKYVCSVCGYIYDEAREKVPFSELPQSWKCPVCKAAKAVFAAEKKKEPEALAPQALAEEPVLGEKGMVKLSAGMLGALFSNLARGCEKQYKPQEEALFRELADYFTAVAPEVSDADLDGLLSLLQSDLDRGYPEVNAAAGAAGDRGTKRICVWGQKVTAMLASLLRQYQEEGEAFLAGTEIWVCSVCGFVYVGEKPPELCPVCKVPAWKFERTEGRAAG